MAIYFYKEKGEFGYLASYSPHGFYKNGIYWQTVEHYYQASKFNDIELKKKIINAETPKIASSIGRNKNNPLLQNWDNIKMDIMHDAVLAKFLAHHDLAKKLIETGDEEIIEETTKESYWGCGPNKDGLNVYGKILCKVREELKLLLCSEEKIFYR